MEAKRTLIGARLRVTFWNRWTSLFVRRMRDYLPVGRNYANLPIRTLLRLPASEGERHEWLGL
jgi:hypothetical protein